MADFPVISDDDIVLENLPEAVLSSMEVRDRWFARASPTNSVGEFFVVEDLLRWIPGQSIRIAFLGGDTELHRDIEEATHEITEACNIQLDFGFDGAQYRKWTTNDTEYTADIRISFDQSGYFSLLGTDSINPNIGRRPDPVGGRPHQRSLNLGGFHVHRPAGWKGTTRHEFLHALGFHHEHQSPAGGCEDEFRWQDDNGYQPTKDENGRYINDAQGNRPGIYTYLAGAPNFWGKAKVDHNLRRLSPTGLTTGSFDRGSIMLYRFPPLFYRTNPSPCAPAGDGQSLSPADRRGLEHLYPREAAPSERISTRRMGAFESLLKADDVGAPVKRGLKRQFSTLVRRY